jgi:hypothetical protein
MTHSVKSDDELIALLQRTMHKVSAAAPDMEFSTGAGHQGWMATAAAATLVVVGVGAAGLALSAREDVPGPTTPGAGATTPVATRQSVAPTTTSIDGSAGTTDLQDPRSDAWRAAVYDQMAAFGTCADAGVGSGPEFRATTVCTHFVGEQPVDGNVAFVLEELPAGIDTSLPNWQRKAFGLDYSAIVPLEGSDVMFVDRSNGVVRRVAVVTPEHVVLVSAEMVDDQYLPTGDSDLAAVARHLNGIADVILAGR